MTTIVTWSPVDTSTTGLVLSNNNLTITVSSGSFQSTRASNNYISPLKIYMEHTIGVNPGDILIGVGSNAAGLPGQYTGQGTNSIGYQPTTGQVLKGGSIQATINTSTTGDIVRVAWDPNASLFWISINGGNWNNSGANNPATGVGGINMGGVGGGPYPMATGGGNSVLTSNFGQSAFTYSIPTGFNSPSVAINTIAQWNATGLNGTTLSQVSLAASSTTNTNAPQAFGGLGYVAGKLFMSVKITAIGTTGSGGSALGVATSSQSDYLGNNAANGSGFYYILNQFSDFSTAGPGVFTTNDVLDMAVDYTAKKMWVRKNGGSWFPGVSADPATNTGGWSFSSVTGTMFPITKLGGGSTQSIKANFGRTPFTYAIPTGYTGYTFGQIPNANDTWNPADFSSVTLSNGNLTATSTTGSSWGALVRGTEAYVVGKYYLESIVTNNVGSTTGNWALGVANSSQSNYIGINTANAVGYYALNGEFSDFATFVASAANGHTVCMAVDYGAQLMWIRVDGGNWNNNSANDPATGVGGFDISSAVGQLFPVWEANNTGTATTTNFGSTTFVYTVPSGFVGYSIPTTVTLPGVFSTVGIGNLSIISSSSLTLTGVQSNVQIGTLSFNSTSVLIGVQAIVNHGNVIPNVSPTPSGVHATFGIGNITALAAIVAMVSGVQATFNIGNLSIISSSSPPLFGVQSNVHIGTLGFSPLTALTGVQAIFNSGNLLTIITPNFTNILINGVHATFNVGHLIPSIAPYITGIHATFNVGNLTAITSRSGFELGNIECHTLASESTDVSVMLRHSNTGGASWLDPVSKSLGAIGEHNKNVQFLKLGQARDRIFEISWAGPINTTMLGLFIQYEESGS